MVVSIYIFAERVADRVSSDPNRLNLIRRLEVTYDISQTAQYFQFPYKAAQIQAVCLSFKSHYFREGNQGAHERRQENLRGDLTIPGQNTRTRISRSKGSMPGNSLCADFQIQLPCLDRVTSELTGTSFPRLLLPFISAEEMKADFHV